MWFAGNKPVAAVKKGVDPEPETGTETGTGTFIALKCFIDNWRWVGEHIRNCSQKKRGPRAPFFIAGETSHADSTAVFARHHHGGGTWSFG